MENQVKNLTNEERQFLSREIGHKKFTDIANELGCSLDDVRAYAPIVLAERAAVRTAEEAARAAKCAVEQEARRVRVAMLYASGDVNALRSFWENEEGENITDDVIQSAADDMTYGEKMEVLDSALRKKCKQEISEALDEAFAEFLEGLKEDMKQVVV